MARIKIYDASTAKWIYADDTSNMLVSNVCKQIQFTLPSSITVAAGTNATILDSFDLKNSSLTDVLTEQAISSILSGMTLVGINLCWANGSVLTQVDAYVNPTTQAVSLKANNFLSSSVTITSIRLNVFGNYLDDYNATSVGDLVAEIKSDLTDKISATYVQFPITSVTIGANQLGYLLQSFALASSATKDVLSGNTLESIFSGKMILGVQLGWATGGAIVGTDTLVQSGNVSVRGYNLSSASVTVTTIRLLVFCMDS